MLRPVFVLGTPQFGDTYSIGVLAMTVLLALGGMVMLRSLRSNQGLSR